MSRKNSTRTTVAAALLAFLLLSCADDVRNQPLTQDMFQDPESLERLEAQLSEDEKALLEKYLKRARQEGKASAFFDGLTVGEALQLQRMHEQEAQMDAMDDPIQQKRRAALNRLLAIVSVEALSKEHPGRKSLLTLEIINRSSTVVTSLKGTLRPRSKIGYWYPRIEILDDRPLAPGEHRLLVKTLDLNLADNLSFQNVAFDDLTFQWLPERLTLGDGSVLVASTQQ